MTELAKHCKINASTHKIIAINSMMKSITSTKVILLSLIPLVYGCITWASVIQPFIPSQAWLNVLTYGVFPVLVMFTVWFTCVFIWPSTGKTGFQMRIQQQSVYGWRVKKEFIKLQVAIILFMAGMTYLAQMYPSHFVNWFSEDAVKITAEITANDEHGRMMSGLHSMTFITADDKVMTLHYDSRVIGKLAAGDKAKLVGRSNWFGIYIDSVKLVTK